MSVVNLIDKAAEKVGSRYKLAQHLGVGYQLVADWEHGRRNCSPADQARLAAYAGEDAVQQLVRATIEKHAGTKRGDDLVKVLGKLSRATGAALGIVGLLLASLTFSPTPASAASYDV